MKLFFSPELDNGSTSPFQLETLGIGPGTFCQADALPLSPSLTRLFSTPVWQSHLSQEEKNNPSCVLAFHCPDISNFNPLSETTVILGT